MIGKPPLEQERACSTVNERPQAQCDGSLESGNTYLSARASEKVPLCKQKPNSLIGRVVNQLDAPFSLARSMARWRMGGKD